MRDRRRPRPLPVLAEAQAGRHPDWPYATGKHIKGLMPGPSRHNSAVHHEIEHTVPKATQLPSNIKPTSSGVDLQGASLGLPTFYQHFVAREIQRCWRGRLDRRRLWMFHGAGSHLMARRIQRMARGFLGRRRVLKEVKRRVHQAVIRIQALYWGFKARQRVRLIRADVYNEAATRLQNKYRGVLGRRWYEAARFLLRTEKATQIQATFRMMRGRREARTQRSLLKQHDANFRRLLDDYREGVLLARVYAYQAPLYHEDGVAVSPPPPEPREELFIEAACLLITGKHRMDLAHKVLHDALCLFPCSVPAMYLKAIACQVMWAAVGPLRIRRPDVLEEGLEWLRKARRLDGPERRAFRSLEEAYFRTALRLLPGHPLTLLAVAVAVQSTHGFFHDEAPPRTPPRPTTPTVSSPTPSPMAGARPRTPTPPTTRPASPARPRAPRPARAAWEEDMLLSYARCRRLYRRCRALDPTGSLAVVSANERAFIDLFEAKRVVVIERNKAFRPPSAAASGAAYAVKAAVSPKAHPDGPAEAVVKTTVCIARVNQRLVVSITDLDNGHRLMPEVVLHEEEVGEVAVAAAEAEIMGGVPEVVVRGKDRYLMAAEFLLKRMVLVRRSLPGPTAGAEGAKEKGENVVVLTTLHRARDFSSKNVVMERAVMQIQRVFRGMLGRMKVRRLHHRLTAQAEQDDRLAMVLSKTGAYRRMRFECARLIQATYRCWVAWREYQVIKWAAYHIQYRYTIYRIKMRAEIDARRKQQGVQVVECFRGGATISGRPVLLVVKRAGQLNFKLTAYDQQTVDSYVGFIYAPAVQELLQRTNGRVKPWMKDKVVELLVASVALVDAIPNPTHELESRTRGKTIVLHPDKRGDLSTKGKVQAALNRPLRDKYKLTRKYDKILMKERAKQLGLGLVKGGFEAMRPFKPRS